MVSDVNIESNIEGLLMKDIGEEVINPCHNVSISGNVILIHITISIISTTLIP